MADLGNLLDNLHKGGGGRSGDGKVDDASSPASGPTLDDVSRNTVDKLLGRVEERRAAKRGRNNETNSGTRGRGTKQKLAPGGDRYSLRGRSLSLPGSILGRAEESGEPSRCGTLAKTKLDEDVVERVQCKKESLPEDWEDIEGAGENLQRSTEGGMMVERLDVSDDKEPPDNGDGKDPVDDEGSDWEEGVVGFSDVNSVLEQASRKEWNGQITIDADGLPGEGSATQQKPSQRRATAKDKEFAEMVHKAHLLCLLARGRIVDTACNDPLLQASILSVLPAHLGLSVDVDVATTGFLKRLVSWFMGTFRILPAGEGSSSKGHEVSHEEFLGRLLKAVQKQAGSAEEVAGLSVTLLRGLGFTTRYVMVLDVTSLKPDADSLDASAECSFQSDEQGIKFSPQIDLESSRVASLARILARSAPQQFNYAPITAVESESVSPLSVSNGQESGGRGRRGKARGGQSRIESGKNGEDEDDLLSSKTSPRGRGRGRGRGSRRGRGKSKSTTGSDEVSNSVNQAEIVAPEKKRGGDDEFERHLAMAIAATSAVAERKNLQNAKASEGENAAWPDPFSPGPKKLKGIKTRLVELLAPKQVGGGTSGAVWSRKFGPVMHWAEVYCCGEGTEGGWIHVDAGRGTVDGAEKVEGAAAACRVPLRYVVAFAGSGAKDVTRRYVSIWSTVSTLRVDESWWEETLKPLRQMEVVASAGHAQKTSRQSNEAMSLQAANLNEVVTKGSTSEPEKPMRNEVDRNAIEDMELETKTFTEPLPTNQQAYKSHHIYVIERWLTKYQTLHPKGPVLGYCAGHAVYPRTCVQTLHTADRWLHEGFKVKPGETPAKEVKSSRLTVKEGDSSAMDLDGHEDRMPKATTLLYGKWQTQPWQPPAAVNGKVPKNERGQVDAYSEKCIPPGTVHLRLPRLVPIVQKLQIDFAPAMVGFEVRKGRSFPVYEGIVVCTEFKDIILDAHKFQEEARFSDLLKKREDHAAKRWWNLLHSMGTRQRLQATYGNVLTAASDAKGRAGSRISRLEQARGESSSRAPNAEKFPDSQPSPGLVNSPNRHRQSLDSDHVHKFLEEDQSYDEESGIRTKKCSCGFTFHVEEM